MKRHFSSIVFALTFLIFLPQFLAAQINWYKYQGNPVLRAGSPGSWDDNLLIWAKVLFEDSTFHLWYGATRNNVSYEQMRVGYASSPDGIHWTKYDDPATTNPPYAESDPVLGLGPPGSFDEHSVINGPVLYDGVEFKMWYNGFSGPAWGTGHIKGGLATSPNGIHWTKADSVNPIFEVGPPGSWDSFCAAGRQHLQNVVYRQ
jgi:hypothetical protein